jgi:hypothetical protein
MSVLELEPMAKKKAKAEPVGKQAIIISYKADQAVAGDVKAWMEELADKIGVNVTSVVDIALKRLGEAEGMRPMPRRRMR